MGSVFLARAVYCMTRVGWSVCWHRRYQPEEMHSLTQQISAPDVVDSTQASHPSTSTPDALHNVSEDPDGSSIDSTGIVHNVAH